MGKCKVISHDGDGLYTVLMLPDYTRVDTEIEQTSNKLDELETTELVQAEADYLEKKSETDAQQAIVDAAIATYAADPTAENLKTVNNEQASLGDAIIAESEKKIPYEQIKARKLALQKRIAQLYDSIVIQQNIQIWCADLSDGLKDRKIFEPDDEAGTIEILGEDSNGINLQPQYLENGYHIASRDGYSMPTIVMTPETYFYNRAMLSPWQKWQHVYRTGIITGVSAGGFTVALDNIKSDEQNPRIPVNNLDGGTITDVTAVYLNCNEGAFSVDDHVIIQSTYDVNRNRTDIIIGFVDNPLPCDYNGISYHPFVIGGSQPGFHDWQNIQVNPVFDWVMKTPVTSDVITDGTGDNMRDWKGFLNDGEKILAQWEYRGDNIYIDGVKKAVTPNFTLTAAAGDPFGDRVPAGFYAAWVTKDNQYIYAVTYSTNRTRHIIRKTNVIELTGQEYNATTAPDGWEVADPISPVDFTNFIIWGEPKINQSGDEGRAMDSWIHGAHRTPQSDPGAGAAWRPASEYYTSWSEESQFTIANPSAATIAAAGIVHQLNGLIGGHIYRYREGYDHTTHSGKVTCGIDYYASGVRTIYDLTTYSGAYADAVGFNGDTVVYTRNKGIGTFQSTDVLTANNTCLTCIPPDTGGGIQTRYERSKTLTTTAGGYGTIKQCDTQSWIIGIEVFEENESISMSQPAAVCNDPSFCSNSTYNQTWSFSVISGGMELANINDDIYRFRTDEVHQTRVASFGSGGNGVAAGTCAGSVNSTLEESEHGYIELGPLEKELSRVVNSTSYNGPADIDNGLTTFPPMLITYTDDPLNPGPPTPFTDKYNWTAHIPTWTTHTSRFLKHQACKDFLGNYLSWDQNQYNDALTTVYGNYLTNGDLSTLDGLDNGTGTQYLFPHVTNG